MAEPAAGKQILIVEDDDDIATAFARIFEAEGYVVRRAADGEEGLALAREGRPDLVLLDLMMPVKDGVSTCRELKQLPGLRDVPVIVLTAYGEDVAELYGEEGGKTASCVFSRLEKPVEPNVLLEHVSRALAGT